MNFPHYDHWRNHCCCRFFPMRPNTCRPNACWQCSVGFSPAPPILFPITRSCASSSADRSSNTSGCGAWGGITTNENTVEQIANLLYKEKNYATKRLILGHCPHPHRRTAAAQYPRHPQGERVGSDLAFDSDPARP